MIDGKLVNIELVVSPTEDSRSMFDPDAFATVGNLDAFRANRNKSVEAARKLQNCGFEVKHIGEFSISATSPAGNFEEFFQTTISEETPPENTLLAEGFIFGAPESGTPWRVPDVDGLDRLVERAYIQRPPIYFAGERPLPPFWNDKFRLRVPGDIAQIMNASTVHQRGITGHGVKVAMADTGFYHHPYFKKQGYNFLAVTAPDAVDHTTDANGHGTGECANLFSTAPGINFIGIKHNNPTLGIKTAIDLKPDIMTNSWGYDMDRPGTTMPNFLRPLHLAVLDAVSRGIAVCFSAGNGHYAFPGSMPEVISVGGVMVDDDLTYSATDYTSGFASTWFPGRNVPDFSGLCGETPGADYIILPVQDGAGAERAEGWGAFSGTSAASPMVAGVCALLKEADSSLTPEDIKNLLKFTARDVTIGSNAHGEQAQAGPDLATGFGLVDAARAIEAVI